MALPKIVHPTYTVTIPSTKQQITLRPFTVQEEKILMMAKTSEKTEDIINCMNQIVRNCVLEPIEVEKLATFDIEYIFIKLRAKSIGEIIDLEYNEPNKEQLMFKVNLDDVEVNFNPEHTNKINVHGKVFFQMKYPTLEDMKSVGGTITEDNILDILYKCIDNMFDDEEVYTEYTKEELENFINNLPLDSIANITKFFDTMPAVEHKVTIKNKQGELKEVVLKGINNFFTF